MGNVNASARYAIVEFNDDGTSGITSDIHFFADIDKAALKFTELLENYQELYPDFHELCKDRTLVQEHLDSGWDFEMLPFLKGDSGHMSFAYYNWDDDYVRVYLTRVQANTSLSIRY